LCTKLTIAKFNSKTHVTNMLFVFISSFVRSLTSKFSKSANRNKLKFIHQKCNTGFKNAKVDFESIEKAANNSSEKSHQRKSYRKFSFLFLLLCANIFGLKLFLCELFCTFNGFKQAANFPFSDTHIEYF
jgi:hypothetical protein